MSLLSLDNDFKSFDLVVSFFFFNDSSNAVRRLFLSRDIADLIELDTLSNGLFDEDEVPDIDVGCVEVCGGINEVGFVV